VTKAKHRMIHLQFQMFIVELNLSAKLVEVGERVKAKVKEELTDITSIPDCSKHCH